MPNSSVSLSHSLSMCESKKKGKKRKKKHCTKVHFGVATLSLRNANVNNLDTIAEPTTAYSWTSLPAFVCPLHCVASACRRVVRECSTNQISACLVLIRMIAQSGVCNYCVEIREEGPATTAHLSVKGCISWKWPVVQ